MQRLLEPEDHDNGDMLILEDHSHNLISMLGLKTDFEVGWNSNPVDIKF